MSEKHHAVRTVASRPGFTLMEMLIVVAIINLLIAMLLPALNLGRKKAQEAECKANLKALAAAYQSYSRDNNRKFIGSNTGDAWDWLGNGNNPGSITGGALWPYTQSMETYVCPNHVYPWYLNSYSCNGMLNGEQQTIKGLTKDHWTSQMKDAGQLIFIEEDDNRGWNINSFMLGTTQGKFVDLVPANHNKGDNLAFLDGHVEYWQWLDEDMHIRPKHGPGKPTFGFSDPGNLDWDRLIVVFRSWQWN